MKPGTMAGRFIRLRSKWCWLLGDEINDVGC